MDENAKDDGENENGENDMDNNDADENEESKGGVNDMKLEEVLEDNDFVDEVKFYEGWYDDFIAFAHHGTHRCREVAINYYFSKVCPKNVTATVGRRKWKQM